MEDIKALFIHKGSGNCPEPIFEILLDSEQLQIS